MTDKLSVLAFVKKNSFCVLSTATLSGKPESAVMSYTTKDDFTILISTETTTRKYPNILANPQASVVIGGLNSDPSAQLDGQIKVLQGPSADEAKTIILSVHPDMAAYVNTPNTKFLAFTPVWLRYSDFSQNPPEIVEFDSF